MHFITLCTNLSFVPATFGDHLLYLNIIPVSIASSSLTELHEACMHGPVLILEFPHNMQILSNFMEI